jgi:hypothetical protein
MTTAHRIATAAATLGALALLASCSTATSPNPTSTTTTATQPAAPAPTSTSATTWFATTAQIQIAALEGSFTKIGTDGDNWNALHTDCTTLAGQVHTAETSPAAPDPTVQASWTKALGQFSAGAAKCQTAATSHSEDQADAAVSDLTTGAADLGTMSARIVALSG